MTAVATLRPAQGASTAEQAAYASIRQRREADRLRQRQRDLIQQRLGSRPPERVAPLYPSLAEYDEQQRLAAYHHRRAHYEATGETGRLTIFKA